jgi:hypothetical protein
VTNVSIRPSRENDGAYSGSAIVVMRLGVPPGNAMA